jgi:hypothetical protein
MRPVTDLDNDRLARVNAVLCDIDDTLTVGGRLPAAAYDALEALSNAGLWTVPITGRPAGWCDHIARMWPVDGVVGENGALYYRYDRERRTMVRRYWKDAEQRRRDRERLEAIRERILDQVPGSAVAADQPFRLADLAIDFREDVEPLPVASVDRIVALFEQAGATARISSIHVNGWFGDYDKLAMSKRLLRDELGLDADADRDRMLFVGDSPNDAPMFAFFPLSVGVANIREFGGRLAAEPAFVTAAVGGYGFAELAGRLLTARRTGGRRP